MGRQRNVSQMKEHEKAPEKELTEMETCKLQDSEFKTMVIFTAKETIDRMKRQPSELGEHTCQ